MSEAYLGTIPVISGFFPDPTICRVGDDYYLANSSFEYFPGAPIHHSRDLVNWEHIGNIIDRPAQHRFGGGDSAGIYGSTLRHHDDTFWFVTTNMNDFAGGQVIYHSDNPAGPWSEAVRVPIIGIDPDLAWDDDGRCLLTLRAFEMTATGPGDQFIGQAVVDPHTGSVLEPVKRIWSGSGAPDTEGPHLYHVGDFWFLVVAEGGTKSGHMVTVARSSAPDGPFTLSPVHPLLTRRSTEHPVQAAGHGDLVQTPSGQWAMVHLGTRPRGFGYGFHTNGRETFVTGITWTEDHWPTINEAAFVVDEIDHSFTERFTESLHHRWVAVDRELDFASVSTSGLELDGNGRRAELLTRVRDLEWQANADIDVRSGVGGVELYLASTAWCELRVDAGEAVARAHLPGLHVELGRVSVGSGAVTVHISSKNPLPTGRMPSVSPDILTFAVSVDGEQQHVAELDGRYLSTEFEGKFTGRMVGPFAERGVTSVREFRYTSG